MTEASREKWLILEDSATDRRRMVLAIENAAIEPVLASTVTEAQEILKSSKIDVCILDFFLRGTSSRHLIASLRKQFPAMPIVVVSGYAGKEECIYKAGADVVLPKVPELDAFGLIVRNAVSHARSLRSAKAAATSVPLLYMSSELKNSIESIVSACKGNILVRSDAGMGRTALARALAESLLAVPLSRQTDENLKSRKILTFTCAQGETFESADKALFGETGGEAKGEAGLIAAAKYGVLIIEEVNFLPLEVQHKLKSFVACRKMKSNNGTTINTGSVQLIFTTLSVIEEHALVAQFETHIAQHVVTLPPFSEMLRELRQVIDFFFSRAIRNRQMKPEKRLVREILDRIQVDRERVTLRSIALALEGATQRAAEEGRDSILIADFCDFADLYDRNSGAVQRDQRQFTLASDDDVGVVPWRTLYEIVRSGSLADGEDLLRKMMIEYAMLKYRGNKTSVASHLGIARQHLYKPSLRELHFSSRDD